MSFFKLEKHGTSFKQEVVAGFTTFSTMAYILFVNPHILSQTGMDSGSILFATIITSSIATLVMGLLANYPFALAPGMGLNAYFTYGIVLSAGYSWQQGLGACFWAGIIFLVLNLLGIRKKIMNAIPSCIRIATVGGLGFFLAFIGLRNSGIVVPDPVTTVALGNLHTFDVLMTLLGIILIAVLMIKKVNSAILITAIFTWLIGLFTGHAHWQGIFSMPPDPSPTLFQFDLISTLKPEFWPIIMSFVFIAIFDTAGSLIGLAEQAKLLNPEGRLPRANRALAADAIGTVIGGCTGTSPVTTYMESASGIATGGRTGLTSVVVGILFLASLFFAPLVQSIPLYATTPALLIVGALMIREIRRIDWDDLSEGLPAFLVIVTIPLTFSIATGIAFGFLLYPIIKLLAGRGSEVPPLIWVIAFLFSLKFIWA